MVRHEKCIAFAVVISLALSASSTLAQQIGSYVIVLQDAKIISGSEPVEDVTRGMALKVRGSRPGGWLWVTHHQNGWIEGRNVVLLQTALEYLAAEIAQQPEYAPFYNDRATVLFETGDYAGAIRDYTSALKLAPEIFSLRANRAVAYFELGEYGHAVEDLNEVVRLRPDDAQSYIDRGWAKYHAELFEEAVADYNQALQLDPDAVQAKVNLAWLKATCPEEQFRNGAEAHDLAQTVCEATDNKDPFALGTLAAAQAEMGNAIAAVETQKKAIELASYTRKKLYRERLAFYTAGQPYRLGAEAPTVQVKADIKNPATAIPTKEPQPVDEIGTKPEPKLAVGNQPKSVLTPGTKPAEANPAEGTPPAPSDDQLEAQE